MKMYINLTQIIMFGFYLYIKRIFKWFALLFSLCGLIIKRYIYEHKVGVGGVVRPCIRSLPACKVIQAKQENIFEAKR